MIELPVIDQSDPLKVTSMAFPYLKPHEVLRYMYEDVGAKTPRAHIDFYWKWSRHFGCKFATLGDETVIPCGLYGDEAKYNEGPPQEKIIGIYLNFVLFRPASIRRSRFLIFSLRSCYNLGPHTLYPLFWKLVESLHFAFLGKWPDGSQLCSDGSRFMITELRGDLAWHKAVWQFEERGWQSADVCFFCQAQSKGHVCPYTMLGPEADWAQTEFKDPWLWAGEVLPNRLCPWLGLPGFSIDTVRMCTMHNVNLGLMQTANGSSLSLTSTGNFSQSWDVVG